MTSGEIVLLRHGETEWSATGRHTGRTDVQLTARGEAQARNVAPLIAAERGPGRITRTLASPLIRAWRTAELAGLPGIEADPDLQEWDYGACEGLTTDEIRHRHPGWFLWRDGVRIGNSTTGETIDDVSARVDAVIERVMPLLDAGDVVLVSHGHLLRVLVARWLHLPAAAGASFALDTASVSVLGFEHDEPVVQRWNVVAALS